MNYRIRPATPDDLPALLRLADAARRTMRSSGNPHQWPDGYPAAETFAHDIGRGVSYLMDDEEGHPAGTFAFMPGPEPTYARIVDGTWLDDTLPYHVVHRIASQPQAHGIFAAMLAHCLAHTDNLRMDTHRDNLIMQRLLQRHGFSYCGIIHLGNGDERLAFQRVARRGEPSWHATSAVHRP